MLKKIILTLSLYLFLFSVIPPLLVRADNYQIEEKEIRITQEEEYRNLNLAPPNILSIEIEKILGFDLQSENFSKKNNSSESQISFKIITGKNQDYYLYLTSEFKDLNKNNTLQIPQFLGDSGECPSLFKPCSWIVNSTTGFAYRLINPQLSEFAKQQTYKRFPISNFDESPIQILTSDQTNNHLFTAKYKLNIFNKSSKINDIIVKYTLLPIIP